MTYGFVMDVPAPIQFYDALHAELGRRTSGDVDGLLLHLARQTADGVQVIEVWESREQWECATREVVGPVLAEVLRGEAPPLPVVTEFEVRGLVLPRAGIAV